MRSTYVHVLFGVCSLSTALAQTTMVLQPGPQDGKDATLHGLSSEANTNYGHIPEFPSMAWTFNGATGIIRSAVAFDLAQIPVGSTVISAHLSMYAFDSNTGFGQHSSMSGSNATWIRRITSPWEENTVTWNTHPTWTNFHQVVIPGTSDPNLHYADIDVKELVQDMVDEPEGSFGFLFMLLDEFANRRMNFASSDHPNAALRPKLVVTYVPNSVEEDCVTLTAEKDAPLHGLATQVDNNWGTNDQFPVMAWTFTGVSGVVRSVVSFDLSTIPTDAVVNSAHLSMYAYDTEVGFGLHSQLSGSNAAWIRRVTSPWEEYLVTWNTHPTWTTNDQVSIPGTSDPEQHYEGIDVTEMVHTMVGQPASSHGFLFMLQTEVLYRRLNFASRNHADPSLWPKLEVCYSTVASVGDLAGPPGLAFQAYPVPAADLVHIDWRTDGMLPIQYEVLDTGGRVLLTATTREQRSALHVGGLAPGLYLLRATDGRAVGAQRIVIAR